MDTSILKQIITDFTRVTPTTASRIDHVIVSNAEYYVNAGTVEVGLCDHSLIFYPKEKTKKSQNFLNMFSVEIIVTLMRLFQQDVEQIDGSPFLLCTDINIAATLFRLMLLEIIDDHCPMQKLKLRYFATAWMNTDFLAHVDEHEHWSSKFKKNPCPE